MTLKNENKILHIPINSMKEGDNIKQYFLLADRTIKKTKKGDEYWDITLMDKTGQINAKLWADSIKKLEKYTHYGIEPVEVNEFVAVNGLVELYNSQNQIKIDKIININLLEKITGKLDDFDPMLLILSTPYDIEQMWHELNDLIAEFIQEPLLYLVQYCLNRYEKRFKEAPAARFYHHAYRGGLLEHTLNVTKAVSKVAPLYPRINISLVVAGAVLHDIGKIIELGLKKIPEYSIQGKLTGHSVMSRDLIIDTARDLKWDYPDVMIQLTHIILSHHGSLEFGASVLPKTREAILVNFFDDMDAKLKMADDLISSNTAQEEFTQYHKGLGRSLYGEDIKF